MNTKRFSAVKISILISESFTILNIWWFFVAMKVELNFSISLRLIISLFIISFFMKFNLDIIFNWLISNLLFNKNIILIFLIEIKWKLSSSSAEQAKFLKVISHSYVIQQKKVIYYSYVTCD